MNKRNILLSKCIIWLLAICAMLIVFTKTVTPVFCEESQYTISNIPTEPLYPGDTIVQSFYATADTLSTFEIALSYGKKVSDACTMSLALYCEDTLILEQPLQVNACPNKTFFAFYAEQNNCQGKEFQIKITNTTPVDFADKTVAFSLLATDKEHSYLSNTENYLFNDAICDERLVCRFNYLTGYACYNALTYVFWIFLCALILSEGFTRLCHKNAST